jgi:hypothetical protein
VIVLDRQLLPATARRVVRRTLIATIAVLTVSGMFAGPAHTADYRGFVDVLNGKPTREASQGAGWRTVFRERVPGRVRYSVCLRNLDTDVGNCWRARTGSRGRSRIFVALFVNDRGGPGRWRARWKVAGRVVATWRFRVRPEFG